MIDSTSSLSAADGTTMTLRGLPTPAEDERTCSRPASDLREPRRPTAPRRDSTPVGCRWEEQVQRASARRHAGRCLDPRRRLLPYGTLPGCGWGARFERGCRSLGSSPRVGPAPGRRKRCPTAVGSATSTAPGFRVRSRRTRTCWSGDFGDYPIGPGGLRWTAKAQCGSERAQVDRR